MWDVLQVDNDVGLSGVGNVEITSPHQLHIVVYRGNVNQQDEAGQSMERDGVDNAGNSSVLNSPIQVTPIQEVEYITPTVVRDEVQSPEYSTPPEGSPERSPDYSPSTSSNGRG